MTFNPITGSPNILNHYLSYITSTFYIKNEELRHNFEEALRGMAIGKGPYIDFTDSFRTGKTLLELIEEGVVTQEFNKIAYEGEGTIKLNRPLYAHQEEAIRKIQKERNVVITTGTGSGKTEAFLYPILNSLTNEKEQGRLTHGVRALLIYPMNALANDQLKRMRELLRHYPEITFGSFTGETEETERNALAKYKKLNNGEVPLANERISRERMKSEPPHILITNYAMLEYLLIRPDDNVFFDGQYSNKWQYIVLDEAHTYTGATGIEVSMLMSRLKDRISRGTKIQFILTSATLGEEKDNPHIVEFAQNLSAKSKFEEQDIIRAKRHSFDKVLARKDVDINFYKTLYQIITEDSTDLSDRLNQVIDSYFPQYENQIGYQEKLFEIVQQDQRYIQARKNLQKKPLDVKKLAEKMSTSEEDLVAFVEVANKAKKNNVMLLDARYHMFIRSLEGCYSNLDENPDVSLIPRKRGEAIEGQDDKYYEISVCQFCGEVYLLGGIDSATKEFLQLKNQKKQSFMLIKDKKDLAPYLNVISSNKEKDEEESFVVYDFNVQTGITRLYNGQSFGDKAHHRYLVKNEKQQEMDLKTCYFCNNINKRTGVLRDFYIGQAAATSVLGTSIYEEIPGYKVTVTQKTLEASEELDDFFGTPVRGYQKQEESEELLKKQLLVFSDSRQEAAYFASYFDVTYHNILRRRMMVEAIRETRNTRRMDAEGYELKHVADHLENIIRKSGYEEDEDPKKEAWKTILYEMSTNERNSLEKLGLIHFNFVDNLGVNAIGKYHGKDADTLYKIVSEAFKNDGMIEFPLQNQFTEEDYSHFIYSGKRQYLTLEPANKYDTSFVPKRYNKWTKYISKTAGFDLEVAKNYLRNIWNGLYEKHEILDFGAGGSKALLKNGCFKIQLTEDDTIQWYKCSKCGTLTPHNIYDCCPQGACDGKLVQASPLEEQKSNHYMNLYQELSLNPMRIKEHTAQLSPEKAKQYQEEFILKKINILSCSTTFEMGVDVGDLETVFMKNMPPSPANYTQRAGRAGRRADSVAYALTFCKVGSHDLTFFKEPETMIRGKIRPPKFNMHNEKIVKRHMQSFLISSFWRQHPALYKDVQTFYEDDNFSKFMEYISDNRENMIEHLQRIIPSGLHHKIEDWYSDYLSPQSIFKEDRGQYLAEVEELVEAMEEFKQDDNKLYLANRISFSLRKVREKNILNYLSARNILPKYGFPIDSVELITDPASVDTPSGKGELRLQRDLMQAISEYAPGSQVIADGKLYTSQYIKRPPQKVKEWDEWDFVQCENPECGHLNLHKHYPGAPTMEKCGVCQQPLSQLKIKTMIKPEYGFIISPEVKKAGSKKPIRTYRGDIYYIGEQKELLDERILSIGLDLKSMSNDELAVVNSSEFMVCSYCGFSEVSSDFSKQKIKNHNASNGRKCLNETFFRKSIGHTFKTDVTTLSVNDYLPWEQAYSVLYSMLEGLSKAFSIERNDVDGTIDYIYSRSGNSSTRFILFDTVPGGAGHVRRLGKATEEEILDVFKVSYDLVKDCHCDENTACYSCLQNYRNQAMHDSLERRFAVDFFERVFYDYEKFQRRGIE